MSTSKLYDDGKHTKDLHFLLLSPNPRSHTEELGWVWSCRMFYPSFQPLGQPERWLGKKWGATFRRKLRLSSRWAGESLGQCHQHREKRRHLAVTAEWRRPGGGLPASRPLEGATRPLQRPRRRPTRLGGKQERLPLSYKGSSGCVGVTGSRICHVCVVGRVCCWRNSAHPPSKNPGQVLPRTTKIFLSNTPAEQGHLEHLVQDGTQVVFNICIMGASVFS